MGERWTHELNQSWIFRFQRSNEPLMESIAASNDRVVIHQAMKHLVVSQVTCARSYMGKEGLDNVSL